MPLFPLRNFTNAHVIQPDLKKNIKTKPAIRQCQTATNDLMLVALDLSGLHMSWCFAIKSSDHVMAGQRLPSAASKSDDHFAHS